MSETAAATERSWLETYPSFKLYWSARVLSALAFQMLTVGIGWLVYDRTGSAYALGFVGLVQFAPMLILLLLIGPVVDRFDRRRIITICQAATALALAALVISIAAGRQGVAEIYLFVFFVGASRAFEQPSTSALLPTLVSAEAFPKAVALSTSAMQTATIIGPALGGLIYAFGPMVPFITACACYAVAATLMGFVQSNQAPSRREPVTLNTLFSGFAYIFRRPIILGSISLDMFAVLLGGATALLPIYARDILMTGPWGLGLLRTAPAVGALAMSLVLARVPLRTGVGVKMFAAVVVFGLATIAFGASTNLYAALAALAVMGAADVVSVVIRSSLVQLSTPDDMRGRVGAVNALFIGTSNQVGEFESGVTAGLFGAVPAVMIGGVGTILVALVWMRLFPDLRKAKTLST